MFERNIVSETFGYEKKVLEMITEDIEAGYSINESIKIASLSIDLLKAQAINNLAYSINRGDEVPTIGEGLVMIAEALKHEED